MLARIERLNGVLDAWTDRSGAKIVVSFDARTAPDETIALVTSALAPRYGVKQIQGAEADEAVRACQAGAPGWFRSRETVALSREEARVLAARCARRAAEQAGLERERVDAFERHVRDALVRVFEGQEKRDAFDGRDLNRRIRSEIARVVDEMALGAEQAGRLRAALEAEWGRLASPAPQGEHRRRWF